MSFFQQLNMDQVVAPFAIKCKMAGLYGAFIIMVLWAGVPHAIAEQNSSDKAIISMLKAAKDDNWGAAQKRAKTASDPLGYDLYRWLAFQDGDALDTIGARNFSKIKDFIETHEHWPQMTKIRIAAEENMPRDLSPVHVVQWFDDYKPLSTTGMDRYIAALIASGSEVQAKLILENWWASALIPRADQKTIYNKYENLLGRNANIKRLDGLLLKGHYTSGRAIAAVLGADYQKLTEARIALAQNKKNVNALIAGVPDYLQKDAGLMYERLRWRRKNDLNDGMIEIFQSMPKTKDIRNPKDWWHERHILIRRFLEQKNYRAAFRLARSHIQSEGFAYAQAEWLTGWIALRFMNQPNVALARFQLFNDFVQTPVSKARGAYWLGQAYKALGNDALRGQWMREAAGYQTVFYGQLAGLELGQNKTLSAKPPPQLSAQEKEVFRSDDLVRASALLHKAGFKNQSNAFLNAFVTHHDTAQAYVFAAEYASEMKRYDMAVRIAKEASRQGLFLTAQSYPVIIEWLQSATGGKNVEWALIHALIRQESLFDIDAQSHAGALGLMQLLPSTAKIVARQEGVSFSKARLTSQPEYNIRLGARYLEDLLDRYDRSYPLAIAGYNAGPGRVDRWLKTYGDPRKGDLSFIDWIELIPIYETRNYVQRVTEGLYVYRLRLQELPR